MTQFKKLHEPEAWIARMTEGLDALGDCLGVVLVQLPPHFPIDLPRLDYFLQQMPERFPIAMEFRHRQGRGSARTQTARPTA